MDRKVAKNHEEASQAIQRVCGKLDEILKSEPTIHHVFLALGVAIPEGTATGSVGMGNVAAVIYQGIKILEDTSAQKVEAASKATASTP